MDATAADVSPAEKMHVLALDGMVHGRFREAAVIYETILTQNHSDLLALRCCFDLYLLLGCGQLATLGSSSSV